jgi:hypothetical protein
MKRFASFFAALALFAQSLQPAFASGFSTVGGASGPTTLTGDVTGSGTGTVPATIPAGTITLTKQANLAANSIIGNNTGAGATPLALTTAQTKSLLAIANTDVSGLGTASIANTGTSGHTLPFLDGANAFSSVITANGGVTIGTDIAALLIIGRYSVGSTGAYVVPGGTASGLVLRSPDNTDRVTISNSANTFANPIIVGSTTVVNGSGVLQAAAMPALTGDVTSSAGAVATTIAANAVSYAKMQSVTAARLLGNPTGSGAVPSEISLAGGLGFSGTTLTAAGALTPTSVASTGAISGTTVAATSSILSSGATNGIGYTTGAGGAVSQGTSRVTGVTNNKACGAITMFSAAGSATWATFVVTDSAVAATDVVVTSVKSATNLYMLSVTGVGSGTFNLSFATTGGTATDAPVINYCVVKGVAS